MPPTVSVVIPTYNRAHCVGEAIDSVLAQSYKDFELLVVDDGSNDDTQQVLDSYGSHLTVIRRPNGGASAARNSGIRAAKGEWIAFLDSDDIWESNKLRIQTVDLLKNRGVVAHVMDVILNYVPGQFLSLFDRLDLKDEFTRRPLRERPLLDVLRASFYTPTWLVLRKAIEKAGFFDESFRAFEDVDLLARVALTGPFIVSPYAGARIRRRPGGATALLDLFSTAKLECLRNRATAYSKLKSEPQLTPEERRWVRRNLSGARSDLAIQQMRQHRWRASMGSYIASVADDPGLRSIGRAFLSLSGMIETVRKFKPGRQNKRLF
jgi:glycosyltransferase involved in cell wall biosynthesis